MRLRRMKLVQHQCSAEVFDHSVHIMALYRVGSTTDVSQYAWSDLLNRIDLVHSGQINGTGVQRLSRVTNCRQS